MSVISLVHKRHAEGGGGLLPPAWRLGTRLECNVCSFYFCLLVWVVIVCICECFVNCVCMYGCFVDTDVEYLWDRR